MSLRGNTCIAGLHTHLNRESGFNRGSSVRIISRAGRWSRLGNGSLHSPDEIDVSTSTDTHTNPAIRIRMKVCSTDTTSAAPKLGCHRKIVSRSSKAARKL